VAFLFTFCQVVAQSDALGVTELLQDRLPVRVHVIAELLLRLVTRRSGERRNLTLGDLRSTPSRRAIQGFGFGQCVKVSLAEGHGRPVPGQYTGSPTRQGPMVRADAAWEVLALEEVSAVLGNGQYWKSYRAERQME